MSAIRCLVVDDEPLSRARIIRYIEKDHQLELIGEAENARAAMAAVEAQSPDLMFLDVQMPEIDGFDLLRLLEAGDIQVPATIFVTAFDQYALKAFDASAIDYLLKPFDEERFTRAVRAAKRRLAAEKLESSGVLLEQVFAERRNQRIPIRSKGGRIYFIRACDIQWIEAEGNYLRLHVGTDEHVIRETMLSFEKRLSGLRFIRIHRSVIVNIEAIHEVQAWYTGEYIVRLIHRKELTLSRTYRDRFFELTRQLRKL